MKPSQPEPLSPELAKAENFQRELTAEEMTFVSGGAVGSARALGIVGSAALR